jgi:hypothetical protein
LFVTDRLPANIPPVTSESAWIDSFFEQHIKAA